MATYASSVYNYVGRRLSWSNNGAGANAGQPQRPTAQELSGSPSGASSSHSQAGSPPSSASQGLLSPPHTPLLGPSVTAGQERSGEGERGQERERDDDAGSEQTVVVVPEVVGPVVAGDVQAGIQALGDSAQGQGQGQVGGVVGQEQAVVDANVGVGVGVGVGVLIPPGDAVPGSGIPIMSLPEGSSQAQTMTRRSSTVTAPAEGSASTTNTATAATTTTTNEDSAKSLALPEDDGQRDLRQLLKGIYTMEVTEREKAQKMHAVMTKKYHALKEEKKGHAQGQGQGQGHGLGQGGQSTTPAAKPNVYPPEKDDPFDVTPQDAAKSYHKENELGCSHYKRGVKLQCSTCHKWHTCRFCHDEQEDHSLIRRETRNMLCMHCGKAQPAQQDCRHCGVKSARYYCDKCKLWDDDGQKKIYHCDDCGICRIGAGLGKDFFHCKKCGVCMSITLQDSHRCIERSTECDCPICGEFMFTSTMTVVFMPCGHSIHHKCYYEHMKTSYRCPTCARTIVNMESQFRALDIEIVSQPLPAPYDEWRCLISCNDCSARSNVSFHFLGLKCEICRSYNTRQIRLIKPEDLPVGGGGGEGEGVGGGTEAGAVAARGEGGQSTAARAGGAQGRRGGAGAGVGAGAGGEVNGGSGGGTGGGGTTDSPGATTLIAANAAIVSADAAISMVSAGRLEYDGGGGWGSDDGEDGAGSSGSWSRCGSDLGDSRNEEDDDEEEEEEEEDEEEEEEEEDDFLNLTGHR